MSESGKTTARAIDLSRWILHALTGLLLLSIGTAAALGIVMLVLNSQDHTTGRWLGTMAVLGAASGLALAGAALARRGTLPLLTWLSVPTCLATFGVWSFLLWNDHRLNFYEEEICIKLGLTGTIFSFGLVYTGAFASLRARFGWLSVLRWIVVADAWLVGATVVGVIWYVSANTNVSGSVVSAVYMFLLFTGVPALIGSIALPGLMTRLGQPREAPESVDRSVRLEMTCPRCETELHVKNGAARCRHCRLPMVIKIEEPRCHCGYLLYQLAGDTCPECGRRARCSCGRFIHAQVHERCPSCGTAVSTRPPQAAVSES